IAVVGKSATCSISAASAACAEILRVLGEMRFLVGTIVERFRLDSYRRAVGQVSEAFSEDKTVFLQRTSADVLFIETVVADHTTEICSAAVPRMEVVSRVLGLCHVLKHVDRISQRTKHCGPIAVSYRPVWCFRP